MKLLVLHPGALGDTLLALPALQLFGRRTLRAEITLAGNLDFLDPIARPVAPQLLSLSTLPLHRLYGDEPLPERDLRFWASWDRIVSWTGAGDARFEANLRRANPNATVAAWKPAPGERRHVARIFADSLDLDPDAPLEPFGLPRAGPRGNAIALHPGAGSREKRWPAERFRSLALEIVRQLDADVVVIEGPAEAHLAARVADGLPPERVAKSVGVRIGPLAELLGTCRAFVGNDSGIAHLAAACGAPAAVLFGPTDPVQWAPLGGAVAALRNTAECRACAASSSAHTCLDNISVRECISAVGGLLRCVDSESLTPPAGP